MFEMRGGLCEKSWQLMEANLSNTLKADRQSFIEPTELLLRLGSK